VKRHEQHGEVWDGADRLDSGGYCTVDHQEWPCDAFVLSEALAQVGTEYDKWSRSPNLTLFPESLYQALLRADRVLVIDDTTRVPA
jgi:hypothetical protein